MKLLKNFTYLLTSIFLGIINWTKPINTDPLEIKGHVEMQELNKEIPVYLEMVTGHPYIYVNIDFYINDVFYNNYFVISKYIFDEEYKLPAIKKPNVCEKITIKISYEDKRSDDTVITFYQYSPGYRDKIVLDDESFDRYDTNPYKATFKAKGSNCDVKYFYERLVFEGNLNYEINENRNIDFQNFIFRVESDKLEFYDYCETRLYYKFEGSDFLYKNGFSTVELRLISRDENQFEILNENRFYVNKYTGMINEEIHDYTSDVAMPFFIPLSIENVSIPLEIVFYDVGFNHDTCIFKGLIKVNKTTDDEEYGQVLSYKYVEIKERLEVYYE